MEATPHTWKLGSVLRAVRQGNWFLSRHLQRLRRLENEMWRAIRLVIDTGVHEEHWSREQMWTTSINITAMDEPNVQTEVDRYIAGPDRRWHTS